VIGTWSPEPGMLAVGILGIRALHLKWRVPAIAAFPSIVYLASLFYPDR
jgi:hypothetical protein